MAVKTYTFVGPRADKPEQWSLQTITLRDSNGVKQYVSRGEQFTMEEERVGWYQSRYNIVEGSVDPDPVVNPDVTREEFEALLEASALSVPDVLVFGHSGPFGGTIGGEDNAYPKRYAKSLGARKLRTLNAGGSVACWGNANAGTDGGFAWIMNAIRPGQSGDDQGGYLPRLSVVIPHHGAEDVAVLGSQNLKAFKEAYAVELSRCCAAVVHEAESDRQLAVPTAVVLTPVASGGSLAPGTWSYKITAYNALGETNGSAEVNATITNGQKPNLAWPAVFGATGYRVYRSNVNSAGTESGYIDVPATASFGTTQTFVDAGGAKTGAAAPPPSNGANMHWSFGSGVTGTIAPEGNTSLYSGGGCRYVSIAAGAANPNTHWAQYQTDPDYPGNLVVAIGLGHIPGAVGAGGYMRLGITVDGVAHDDVVYSLDKGGVCDAENGKNGVSVLRFGREDCGLGIPLSPGQHTIRIAVKDSGPLGAWFIPDYGQIEADPLDGPIIHAPSGFWYTSNNYAVFSNLTSWKHGPGAATDPLTDASVDALIAAQKEVLDDFPKRSRYFDLNGLLNKDASCFYDGTHMNNHTHARVAEAMHKDLLKSGLLTARVANAVGDRGRLGLIDGGYWRAFGGLYGMGNQSVLTNGWVPWLAGTSHPMITRQLDDVFRCKGWVKNGSAAGASIFTVGVGNRPGDMTDIPNINFPSSAAAASIRSDPADGSVKSLLGGSTAVTNLNGVSWKAES